MQGRRWKNESNMDNVEIITAGTELSSLLDSDMVK